MDDRICNCHRANGSLPFSTSMCLRFPNSFALGFGGLARPCDVFGWTHFAGALVLLPCPSPIRSASLNAGFFFFFSLIVSLLFVSGVPEIILGASWLSHVLPSTLLNNRLEFKKPRFRDSTEVVHAASKAHWRSFYAALNAAVCVMAAGPKLI
ncbi:hypothetical protein FOCG_12145 [Fusarium oxysporum f. sp. radicis-lycopersici 26381]|nr:hypothetical protein FOCG_12145 [Fusarium oxysporum f. sp. radicis-lycopersici 26381]